MTDGLLRKAATFFVCRSLRGLHGEGAAVPFHQLYDSISWLAKQMSAVCDTMMSPFLNLSVSLFMVYVRSPNWFLSPLVILWSLTTALGVWAEAENLQLL